MVRKSKSEPRWGRSWTSRSSSWATEYWRPLLDFMEGPRVRSGTIEAADFGLKWNPADSKPRKVLGETEI